MTASSEIDALLRTVQSCLDDLRHLPIETFSEFVSDFRNAPAAESCLYRFTGALFTVIRSFGEIEDEFLRRPALVEILKEFRAVNDRLTHFYQEVTPEELYGIVKDELGDLEQIAEELRQAAARMSGA